MLRVLGQNAEAEAVLRAATRVDPIFAEAWHNLGDLLDEQGRSNAAIGCLRSALRIAPDYADAMFNLALLLSYACAIGRRAAFLGLDCANACRSTRCRCIRRRITDPFDPH